MLVHLLLEVLAQLAFAEDHEARVGHLLHHEVRGVDQVALSLVRHQRGDVADHRRAVRQPERLVHVHRPARRATCSTSIPSCTVTVRSAGTPSAIEHLPDRLGRGDEAVDLAVLPARERVALEVEVDAARRDQRRRRSALGRRRSERQRQRRHRHAVRIVRVDDVGLQPLDDPRELPRRRQVHLGPRRDRNQVEPLRGAPAQLAVRVRDQRRAVADRAQPVDGQQHLVLAAAPGSGGVDVEGEHRIGFEVQGVQVHGSSSGFWLRLGA